MAGVIQADYLQPTSSAGLTILTPSGNTIMSMNTAGVFSSGSSLFVAANGQVLGFGTSFPGTVTANTVTANTIQIGQSGSSSNNFTLYQPSTPDGTVRLRNIGTANDLVTVTSTGNMGIGTNSPVQSLDIQKSQAWITATSTTGTNSSVFKSTNTGGSSYFGRDNSTGGVFGSSAYSTVVYGSGAYPMTFFTNDALRMTLNSSGNLGLGVTPSGWQGGITTLQLGNQGSLSFGGGTNLILGVNRYFYNGEKYIGSGYASCYTQDAGSHQWSVASSGTAGNGISFSQAMTLSNSGYLGIGAFTNPDSRLAVDGRIRYGNLYRIGITGYKDNATSAFDMFNITGLGGQCSVKITISFFHAGGGVHGTVRDCVLILNVYTDITVGTNSEVSFGGGTGFTFSRPSSDILKVRWNGNATYGGGYYLHADIQSNYALSISNIGMNNIGGY